MYTPKYTKAFYVMFLWWQGIGQGAVSDRCYLLLVEIFRDSVVKGRQLGTMEYNGSSGTVFSATLYPSVKQCTAVTNSLRTSLRLTDSVKNTDLLLSNAFEKLGKATNTFVMSACVFVRPSFRPRLPMDGFS
jgi:hypothetical protein